MLDGRLGRARPAWLAIVAMLMGAAVGTTFHPAPAEAVTTYTRAWSCQGRDFMPYSDGQAFGYDYELRIGQGRFQCDADLPHGAVVTRVRFTLRDEHPSYEVNLCLLARVSLAASATIYPDVLANVPGTGTSAHQGRVRVSTTSISYASINRLNYAYYLSCFIPIENVTLGVWGADVTYTITAANS